MKTLWYCVICCVLIAVRAEWHAQNVNPGLKIQITQKGISYAAQEAINVLTSNLRGKTIPDQTGDDKVPVVGHITYTLSGMRINSFSSPITTVTTSPFRWFIRNVGASIHGNWRYRNHAWIRVKDSGSFDISLSGWSLQTTLLWGVDSSGRPTVRSSGCVCGCGDVNVKFHGGASWLYNLFRHKVADAIKKQLQKQLCSSVDKTINESGAKMLASLKVSVLLDKKIELDYRLVQAPAFTSTYMETYHKGEVFWVGDKQEAPFGAPPLPDIQSNKMVTFWVSEYVMNTLGYVEYKHGALAYNLTNRDLPEGSRMYLNTTCPGSVCIGNVIPQLAKNYPNASVGLAMLVTEPPKVSISTNSILSGTFAGNIAYNILVPNKPEKFAFSTKLSVTFSLTMNLHGLNVTANITNFKIGDQQIVKSAIGKIPLTGLNWVVNAAVTKYVQPQLQGLANRGIMLPKISNVQYVAPKLALVKNCLVVATDARYIP